MPTFEFPPRIQFSLRGLLIAVAVVAVLLGVAAVANGILSWLLAVVVMWVLPTPVLITAIYGRGDARALCIGALVPWIPAILGRSVQGSLIDVMESTVWLLVMAGVCGVVAMLTRRWIEWDVPK
jgi:hypothetical protein